MKQFINIITVLVTLLSISSFNAHAQTPAQWQIPSSFTSGEKRYYVGLGLPHSASGSYGVSAYGSIEKETFVVRPFSMSLGASLEIGTGSSIGGFMKSRYAFSEKVDAALVTGLGVGSSGMTRTVGCEATMLVNNKMRVFASGAFIFPGIRELRIGVVSSF